MDEEKILIIVKGEDKTPEIEKISKKDDEKIEIKYYKNEKIYSYSSMNIVIREQPTVMDLKGKDIYYKNQIIFDIQKVIRFEDFVKITYENGEKEIFRYEDVSFKLTEKQNLTKNVIQYFKEIANYVKNDNEEEESEKEESFLKREYGKLNYIAEESILNYYINKKQLIRPNIEGNNIIYPFRFNLSQKQAMENVFKSNVSIIQGPPGTGKTQTILNIIANLAIIQNKTVAVVSNNNEAVKNVKDKLDKNGYGFIVADLGRREKREKFFEDIPQPKVEDFNLKIENEKLLIRLEEINKELDELLEKNNNKAKLEKEIEEYKLEQKYFEKYYNSQNIEEIEKLSFYYKTEDRILEFILDSQLLYEEKIKIKWLYKIKLLFKYGITSLKQLDNHLIEIILMLQKKYYEIKIAKLKEEYVRIKNDLKVHDFESLQIEHQNISEKIFKNQLYRRYNGKTNEFSLQNYQEEIEEFLKAFPIVLSTTYSLRNSVPNNLLFDYVIMDESSQVDLLAGSLALSCARNAIIVGDEKQLPQIVDKKIKEKITNIEVDICHDYFENSMLSAILRTYEISVPQVTLKEHYRCHPKIIEFCNKRYYNNELIAFATKEHLEVNKPLILYYTVEGNHMRKITKGSKTGTFNERELEVIKNEVLQDNRINSYNNDEIGITTPYRMQANNIQKATQKEVQSDTIHKFQGREKKLMILSTVLDSSYLGKKGIHFVDDPCMINVAVSRAIEQFVIVTDKKLFKEEGNDIKALLKYIKYNELDSEIVESQIVSVFDLLYKEYSRKLEKLNSSLLHRSKFKSENIMDTILNRELKKEEYRDYKYEREILVRNIFRDLENLKEEEKRYVNNGARIDFVIYDKMDNKPQLFIEVDGFEYHRNNPKQLEKDDLKNSIARKNGINILRFETGGKSYDEEEIILQIRKEIFNNSEYKVH